MSAAHRQKTCPACGRVFEELDRVDVEPLLEIGGPVRYIAVHWGESTFVHPRKEVQSNAD